MDQWFFLTLGIWFVFWTLLSLIALDNDFIDILENIVWGSHFQLGYDKNPYLGAWLGYAAYAVTGGHTWIHYFLSQAFVASGFIAVYLTARRMAPRIHALLAVVLLFGITFYGMKSAELCDDVMEQGLWPWTVYFFYCAIKEKKYRFWLLTGLFAGLSLMTKYYAPVLFGAMFLILLVTEEGRRSWRSPGPYLAVLIAALLSIPNLIWLYEHGFIAFNYALDRAALGRGVPGKWINHFYYPWRAFCSVAGVIAVPLVFFPALFFRRDYRLPPGSTFNRRFIMIICWTPFLLTLLFSALTGGLINYSWVQPCFAWITVFVFLFYRPLVTRKNFWFCLAVISMLLLLFGGIFLLRSTWYQGYRKGNCDYENYPGRAVSRYVTEEWRRRTGRPLRYVIGNRNTSCNTAVYSPDHPEAYFNANPKLSQWIDEADLRKQGAVVIFDELWPTAIPGLPSYKIHAQCPPNFLRKLKKRFSPGKMETVDFPRAVPAWFIKIAGTPKMKTLGIYFILPEK